MTLPAARPLPVRTLAFAVAALVSATGVWAQTAPFVVPVVAQGTRPATRAPAPVAPAPSAGLLACLIVPERVADIGSPVVGVIETVEVERGTLVKKGQVLARLRADVERANQSVVRSRAESEAEFRGAVANRDLAQQKLDRARSLAAQNFVSSQAVEQADSEYRIAHERMTQAREQLGVTAHEVTTAQAQLAQRVLRSPFDGVVTERYLNPGERVEEKPLLRIATIAQLKVELVASTALFGSLKLGQAMNVQPELAGLPAREARISQIDRVLEPASNTFRLRLDLPNADGSLPAGLRCKATLPAEPAAVDVSVAPVVTSPESRAPRAATADLQSPSPTPGRRPNPTVALR